MCDTARVSRDCSPTSRIDLLQGKYTLLCYARIIISTYVFIYLFIYLSDIWLQEQLDFKIKILEKRWRLYKNNTKSFTNTKEFIEVKPLAHHLKVPILLFSFRLNAKHSAIQLCKHPDGWMVFIHLGRLDTRRILKWLINITHAGQTGSH